MKPRNVPAVIGVTYAPYIFGYIGLSILSVGADTTDNASWSALQVVTLIAALILVMISGIYALYWYVSTASSLRKITDTHIPNSFLLVVPIANYWWMWRYSEAADKFTKGKMQAMMGFVLLVLLGGIGIGIMQDAYNKILATDSPQPPTGPIL